VTRPADTGEAAGDGTGVAPRVRRRRTTDLSNVGVAKPDVVVADVGPGAPRPVAPLMLDTAVNATTYRCIIASLAIDVSSLSWTMVVSTSSWDALDASDTASTVRTTAFPQREQRVSRGCGRPS
jgi:hypothetical protein